MADVLYVCQTFPWVTQTFTIREVALLQEQGLSVAVVAFRRPPESLMDDEARTLLACTTYLPAPASAAFILPVLRAVARRPFTVTRLVTQALAARGLVKTTWRLRLRNALAVGRGVWIAGRRLEANHLHAEFPDEAATAAMVAAELSGRSYSFKSHASFNPLQLARKAARARFVVAESEYTRRTYFGSLPEERVLVNHGGVKKDRAETGRAPAADHLRILSVGTLQEKKGHGFLVGALCALRARGVRFSCLIVGSGPLEGELRAAIDSAALADAVVLEPYLPHEEIEQLYRKYDVFVLPCVVARGGDRDGIPAVLIEAGAAGCALVSTPVSGIPELIDDGVSGLLVAERDEDALADALARLTDPTLRRELGLGARAVVRESFDLVRNIGDLAARFRSAATSEAF